MDKFNDFIKNKAREENENFSLPKAFEDKIESVLDDIDNKESIKIDPWYKNRRILTMAACFAFSCLVLIKFINGDKSADFKKQSISKLADKAESIADNSSFELYSEDGARSMDEESYNIESNITLSLSGQNDKVESINGEYTWENRDNSYADVAQSGEIAANSQPLIVGRNEDINMNFSQVPISYQVSLWQDNLQQFINYDQIEVSEYPSQNLIIKAPSDPGMYIFEVIGNWDSGEIKYTIKIQVKD